MVTSRAQVLDVNTLGSPQEVKLPWFDSVLDCSARKSFPTVTHWHLFQLRSLMLSSPTLTGFHCVPVTSLFVIQCVVALLV